jgi:chromosome segregation ATPase
VLDWLGLDRTKMLREAISAYEEDIELERSRVESLREKLAQAQSAGDELEKQGLDHQGHPASLVAQDLEQRIETSDKLLIKMEQLLASFRRDLVALEEGVKPSKISLG